MPEPTTVELRCFCRKAVLLAVCGRYPDTGRLFAQIKHRQGSGFAEVIVTGGVVKMRCHACTRWHTLRMKDGEPALERAIPPLESTLVSRRSNGQSSR